MMEQATYIQQMGYPVQFSVDYPDRPLRRLTTGLRIFWVIPIAIVVSTVSGEVAVSMPSHGYGATYIPAVSGGVLFWGPLFFLDIAFFFVVIFVWFAILFTAATPRASSGSSRGSSAGTSG